MKTVITPEEIGTYRDQGYLKIPNFLSGEEAALLGSWTEIVGSWPASEDKWMHHYEQTIHGICLARTEYVIAYHEGIRQLLTQGKVPETAGQLLGEPAILYKEKFNYKYPGGGGYVAHQDAPAYEFVKNHITCAIAIDEATTENGCLYFSPGLHQQGLLSLNDAGCIDEDVANELRWEPIPMEPGDALYFSSYAPHKSAPNESSEPRRNLYLTYNAKVEGDLRESYYRDKREALANAQTHSSDHEIRISKIGHFNGKPVRNG